MTKTTTLLQRAKLLQDDIRKSPYGWTGAKKRTSDLIDELVAEIKSWRMKNAKR